jgi:ankyrin repeat protein
MHEHLRALRIKEHEDERYPYYDVVHNRTKHLLEILEKNREVVESVDAMGASIIHVAYLHQHYDLARTLVETFPEEALKGYSDRSSYKEVDAKNMPYTGVSIW